MANPVVLVEPDPFVGVGATVVEYIPSSGTDTTQTIAAKQAVATQKFGMDLSEIQAVSRPLNGIAAKPNTHAYVQVIQSDQTVVKVFNQLGMPLDYAQSGEVVSKEYAQALRNGATPDTYARSTRMGAFRGDTPVSSSSPASLGAKALSAITGGLAGGLKRDANLGNGYNDRYTHVNSVGMGLDANGDPIAQAWTDWILQSVRESRSEKTQLVETFGDSYLYAFGEKPRILAFQGMLMNTADYNWRGVFWENWDKYFRASRLIEMDARIYISWEDIIVEGYPIQAQCQESATSPNAMAFSFNMYVTNYFNISMANRTVAMANKRLYALGMSRSKLSSSPATVAEIVDSRKDIFSAVMDAGTSLMNLKYEHGISPDGWELDEEGRKTRKLSEIELFGIRQARTAGNMITRAATGAHTQNEAQGLAFLNSFLNQFMFDTLTVARNAAQNALATLPGMDIQQQNAWFGFAGQLTENWFGDGARWGGSASDGRFADALTAAFKGGSMDRLIQEMAYQTVGAMGIGDGASTGVDTVGDVKATGGYAKYGAYPGAATIVPLTDVNYGASTTSLTSIAGTAEAGDPFGDGI